MSAPWVVLAVAVCGVAALLTARALRAEAGTTSRWLGTPGYVVLAGSGGAAAAHVARTPAELAAYAVLAVACSALVLVDLATERLPDSILGPSALVFFVLLALAALASGEWGRLARALTAALVLLVGYLLLALARPSGLGLGDVKLAGLLGGFLGWLGWNPTLLGALLGFVVGGTAAAVAVLTRRRRRGGSLPFGPSMVAGALLGAVLAVPVLG